MICWNLDKASCACVDNIRAEVTDLKGTRETIRRDMLMCFLMRLVLCLGLMDCSSKWKTFPEGIVDGSTASKPLFFFACRILQILRVLMEILTSRFPQMH